MVCFTVLVVGFRDQFDVKKCSMPSWSVLNRSFVDSVLVHYQLLM